MRIDNSIFDVFFGVADGGGSNSNSNNNHSNHNRQKLQQQQQQHVIMSPPQSQPPTSPTMSKRRKAKYYTRPVFKEPASMDEYLQRQRQRLRHPGEEEEQQDESRSDSAIATDDHNKKFVSGGSTNFNTCSTDSLTDHRQQQDYRPSIVESLRPSIVEEIFGYGSRIDDDNINNSRGDGAIAAAPSRGFNSHSIGTMSSTVRRQHHIHSLHDFRRLEDNDVAVDLQEVIDPSSSERKSRLQRLVGPTALTSPSIVGATVLPSSTARSAGRYSTPPPTPLYTHHPVGVTASHRRSLHHRPVSMPMYLDDDEERHDPRTHHRQFHHDHHHHHHRGSIIDVPDDSTECGSSIVSVSDLDILASKSLRSSTSNRDKVVSRRKQLSDNKRQEPPQNTGIWDYFSSLCTGSGQQEQRDDLAVIREEIAGIIDDEREDLETNGFGGLGGCISTVGWL